MAVLFDPHYQAVDANGLPIAGATLAFYEAGTSTPVTTYQNESATTPHANPVVADSSGLFAPIYLVIGDYKTILKTAAGATVQTVDNISIVLGVSDGDKGDIIVSDEGTEWSLSSAVKERLTNWVNLIEMGADPTGVANCHTALLAAQATGSPIYVPAGTYRMASSFNIASDFFMFGDGIDLSRFVFDADIEGFACNTAANETNIRIRDLNIEAAGNWGANTKTGLLLSNVSYSEFSRVKIMYFQYGAYLRRTDPGGGYLECYFNDMNLVHTFGCQYGITVAEAGGSTPNDCAFRNCMAEDNGQRSGGYGLDIDGVGHTVSNFYGGLPFHTAAVRLGAAALNCTLIDIYGESPELDMVLKDDTGTGRNNVIINVHADGVPIVVTRANPASNAVYINAGTSTNVPPYRASIVTKGSTTNVVTLAYDYMDFAVTGIAYGDVAEVMPPAAWPPGLIRGTPLVSAGSVRVAYFNGTAGTLTPTVGDYRVVWQDLT